MQRDPDRKSDDGLYSIRRLIPESASEYQELAKVFPDSREIPTTHELFVEHGNEMRKGVPMNFIDVGVRLKPAPPASPNAGEITAPIAPHLEDDGLNKMNHAQLEVEAAKVNFVIDPKKPLKKAEIVAAIRDLRAKQSAPPTT